MNIYTVLTIYILGAVSGWLIGRPHAEDSGNSDSTGDDAV